MSSIAPPIANEREYVAWFAKNSPECELLRSWIVGDMDKFAITTANLCEKTRVQADNADKLFAKVLELSKFYAEQILPVLNEHGGLAKLLSMPPKLIQMTIQVLTQIIIFKEILVKKYNHKEARELFAMIDVGKEYRI